MQKTQNNVASSSLSPMKNLCENTKHILKICHNLKLNHIGEMSFVQISVNIYYQIHEDETHSCTILFFNNCSLFLKILHQRHAGTIFTVQILILWKGVTPKDVRRRFNELFTEIKMKLNEGLNEIFKNLNEEFRIN